MRTTSMKFVNADEEMYNAIDSIPNDDTSVANNVIAIVNNHVSEVWSPPRVTKLAPQFRLEPGFALDIQTNDATGKPWDFDDPAQRAQCIEKIINEQPKFPVGSPMCTAFTTSNN